MGRTEDEIKAARDALDRELRELRAHELTALRDELRRIADRRGETYAGLLAQLAGKRAVASSRRNAPRRNVEPARFACPNSAQTWSGRGPQPAWYRQAIRDGFTAAEMAIAARILNASTEREAAQ